MSKLVGAMLLMLGAVLLIFGFSAPGPGGPAAFDQVSRVPADQSLWLLVGGGALTAAGLYLLLARLH